MAGVATLVAPAVRLLDKIYATRVTLEDLSSKYGDQPLQWPVHVVEQLRERNTAIIAAIEGSICALPSGLYFPLGTLLPSREAAKETLFHGAAAPTAALCSPFGLQLQGLWAKSCSRLRPQWV